GAGVPLPHAVLLTLPERFVRAGVEPLRHPVPGTADVDPAGIRGAAVPARLPPDLLLLPQGLLPLGLVLPARLRGGRAARALHRRDQAAADRAERAPLLLLCGADRLVDQHLRRVVGIPRRRRRIRA